MKKYIAILLIIIISLSLYGCSANNGTADEGKNDEVNNVDQVEGEKAGENNDQIVDPNPDIDETEVTLYYVNNEYIETGDDSLQKLVPEKRTISAGNIPLEEAIVKELMKNPESKKLSTVISSNITLLGVEVADKTAFVNFSQEGLYGGSMQEDFTIAQIVNTLLELDHIDKVQFLIDGKKAETLMGHISITEPFEEPLYSK